MELPDRQERDDDAAEILAVLLLIHGDRFADALGEPPDVANISSDLWTAFEADLTRILTLLLFGTFLASAQFHGATEAVKSFGRVSGAIQAGLRWAAETAKSLAASLVESTRKMLARLQTRSEAGNTITDEDVEAIFGADRAGRIGMDVVTIAQTAGGEWAVDQAGQISSQDVWQTAGDACPTCSALHGTTRDSWGETYPGGPPAHPNCRCSIVYVALPEND